MNIYRLLCNHLQSYKRSIIKFSDLENLCSGHSITYEQFAIAILQLEQEQVLIAIKSTGRNHRTPSLAQQYRIQRQRLIEDQKREIQQYATTLHSLISLDAYHSQPETVWKKDLPYLIKLDEYLKKYSVPDHEAPAPERSFEISGDEKWITDKGGQALLEKIGIWERLRIVPVSDPLMMAFNLSIFTSMFTHTYLLPSACQIHLIVENKTTFQSLLQHLEELPFATLIYGCGRKIVGNLGMFEKQYPLHDINHIFYYFGDLDWEGIRIWYNLQTRYPVKLATTFYGACLEFPAVKGKHNQFRDKMALQTFLKPFTLEQQQQLQHMLENGCYIPQEVLNRQALLQIGRSDIWTTHLTK